MKKKSIKIATSLSFAAILPLSFIPINNSSSITSTNLIVNNKASVVQLEKQPDTLEQLRDADINSLATLKKYDSRQYDIITYPKNQETEGICWCFATAGASEASLLREGIADHKLDKWAKVDLAERNIDYMTNVRNKNFDLLGLNPRDTYSRTLGKGGVVRYAANGLSMWDGPIEQYPVGKPIPEPHEFHKPDFILENTDRIPSMKDSIKEIGLEASVTRMKKLIAKHGSVTASYVCYGTNPYTNTNYKGSKDAGHAVSVIGWDDSISKKLYTGLEPETDGGWICKNSWGENKESYFYISYDSDIFDVIGFDYAKAQDNLNNYFWDANTVEGSDGFESEKGPKENAAIYPAKKANFDTEETLEAVQVGIIGKDVDITVEIYEDVKADFLNATSLTNNPKSGKLVDTLQYHSEYEGFKTIPLNNKLKLGFGKNFSIVVKINNKEQNARFMYANDLSNDNMTFANVNGQWVNNMSRSSHAAARIKAITSTKAIENAQMPEDLAYSHISLDKGIWVYGSKGLPQVKEVKIGNTTINPNNYEVEQGPINIVLPFGGTTRDDEIIGTGELIIKGKNAFKDTKKSILYKVQVGMSPDLQGVGEYQELGSAPTAIINLNVGNNVSNYSQIALPKDFVWEGNTSQSVENGTSKLILKYQGKDQGCYRRTYWEKERVNIKKLGNAVVPEQQQNLPPITQEEAPQIAPPAPAPSQGIKSVKINLDKTNYKEGDKITANAVVSPNDIHGVSYKWFIGNRELGYTESITFDALGQYNGQTLRVEATYDEETKSDSVTINIKSNNNTVTPTPQPTPDNKPSQPVLPPNNGNDTYVPGNGNHGSATNDSIVDTTIVVDKKVDWWVYGLIGLGGVLLVSGIAIAIVISKKKKDIKNNAKPNISMYQQPVDNEVKTIPVKTSND